MISVTVLTKNSQETLEATLASLREFPEVVVYDSGSTDATLAIAKKFSNVKIVRGEFAGFGPTHNVASALTSNDWILSVDSDEVLTPELVKEILSLALDSTCVYKIHRHNYFNGKWIRTCAGWYPDPVLRLYNRKHTQFTDDAVHEKISTDGMKVQALLCPMLHTPYRCMGDFLAKMQSYSTLFAEQHRGKKSSSLFKALVHGCFAFLKSYLFKKGVLDGREGFLISLYNGHTTFYKYMKLLELSK